jgi:hypothetical protein
MPANVVRSDRGVALATYNRDPAGQRLRMLFVTMGTETGGVRELWMGTYRETAPGVLGREAYRAVPLATVNASSSQSAGGLAAGVNGFPLWHMWGQGSPTRTLHDWVMYGN